VNYLPILYEGKKGEETWTSAADFEKGGRTVFDVHRAKEWSNHPRKEDHDPAKPSLFREGSFILSRARGERRRPSYLVSEKRGFFHYGSGGKKKKTVRAFLLILQGARGGGEGKEGIGQCVLGGGGGGGGGLFFWLGKGRERDSKFYVLMKRVGLFFLGKKGKNPFPKRGKTTISILLRKEGRRRGSLFPTIGREGGRKGEDERAETILPYHST